MNLPLVAESWPLVGRDRELALVESLLADPTAPGIVLAGPAGVGKTRLADECALRSPVPVLAVPATRSAAQVPLGAFAAFLPAEGLGIGDDYVRLRRAADALLADVDDGVRPVVYVEDAHCLDETSAALVMQLSMSGRVFLLVTLRSGEPIPDALLDLWKDNLRRVDLEPLDRPALEAMAAAMLGGHVDAGTLHALCDVAAGNAMMLRELVTGLRDRSVLELEAGVWRLTGPLAAPPRLAELVLARLDRLDAPTRRALELASLGEPVPLGLFGDLGLGAAVDELERAELVRIERSDRRRIVHVAHPLHGEVARDALGEHRRIELLRELAAWVGSRGARRREDSRRVALWSWEAGDGADGEVLFAAAGDAWSGFDPWRTIELARAAELSGVGVLAQHLQARAYDALGDHERAEELLADAERHVDGVLEAVLVAVARSDNLARGLGRADEADEVAAQAEASLEQPDLRNLLTAQRAIIALFAGRFDEARRFADPLVHSDDDLARCLGALPVSMALVKFGNVLDAVEVARSGLESRRRVGENILAPQEAVSATALALALIAAGRVEEAAAEVDQLHATAVRNRDRHGQAWSANTLSAAHVAAGRWRTAARFARESAVTYGDLRHPGIRFALGSLALAAGIGGQAAEAAAAIEDLDAEDTSAIRMSDLDVERARGWTHAAAGDVPGAVALVAAAADRARSEGLFGVEADARHDLIRLGASGEHATRLTQLGGLVDGELAAIRASFATGLVERDAQLVADAAERFEAIGMLLYAAEAHNEAAILHRAAGSTRPATAARRRAEELAERCEGARTPLLSQGTEAALLTRREREIALLASAGSSSREIADQLVVSIRTVENHLQRAYQKLGVSSRAELTDALSREG